MGLIKAGMGALGGTLADQWKEFFYCDSLDKDVLMFKGQKRTSRRSSNNGEDNIITNGSGIAVADGQCMLIVEQGRVVEVCAEPGEFTFDASTEPSVFTGNFGDSLAATFQTVAKRFTYGGDTAGVLHQHQGTGRDPVRHRHPHSVPCGSQRGAGLQALGEPAVQRQLHLPHLRPAAVLHQRVQQRLHPV